MDKFTIPNPCTKGFPVMDRGERGRLCLNCNRMVLNLSGMTSDEAKELLKQRGRICVACSVDGQGEVITTDYEEIREQRLMVAQCLLAISLLLGICNVSAPLIASLMPKAESKAQFDVLTSEQQKQKGYAVGGQAAGPDGIQKYDGGPIGQARE